MSAMLESLLTREQRAEAAFADFEAARRVAHAAGPQYRMSELQRQRAGIDIRGKSAPNFRAVLADCRWEDELERDAARQALLDEARADTGSGAFDDARDAEREHGAYF